MKKAIAMVLCAVMTLGLAACGGSSSAQQAATAAASSAASEEESGEGKVYKIAIDQAFAPFSILQDDGSYEGIDLDVMAAIAEAEAFEVEMLPMDFSAIIPALVSGTIDAGMGCMTITEERKESVDFSDPYYEDGQALVTRDDDTIASLEDMEGKVLAIKEGTMGALWGEENKDVYGFELATFADSTSTAMAVRNGQADALIEDFPVISYQIKIGEQEGLKVAVETIGEVGDIGISVKKGENQELLQMINEGLKKIRDDGSYEKILAAYEG